MKYTLFHGSKKNVGDFLIHHRAKSLISKYSGISGDDLYEVDMVRKEISPEQLEKVSNTDAVIIAGGPAYHENFYPGVYPSLEDVLNSGIPVYPLGPGWKGKSEEEYTFTGKSVKMFKRIHNLIEFSGVRDLPTKRVLQRHGINNVELVGCPAWYDFECLESPFHKPDSIDSLVISTAVPRSRYYRKQFRYLLSRVADEYPDTDLYCSFHRGIYSDEHTPFVHSLHLRHFKWVAERNGYTIINPAYEIEKLEQYRDIDVHIGFRVHGHIYFLAQRHPSYLLQVDGRGTGVSESLNTPSDVQSFGRNSYKQPVEEVLNNLESDLDDEFCHFNQVSDQISKTHQKMKSLIQNLP